jgi:hypothetical protein
MKTPIFTKSPEREPDIYIDDYYERLTYVYNSNGKLLRTENFLPDTGYEYKLENYEHIFNDPNETIEWKRKFRKLIITNIHYQKKFKNKNKIDNNLESK